MLAALTADQRSMLELACGRTFDVRAGLIAAGKDGGHNVVVQALITDPSPPAVITADGHIEFAAALPPGAIRISRSDF